MCDYNTVYKACRAVDWVLGQGGGVAHVPVPPPGDGMAKRSARSKVSTPYTLHAVEYSARVSGLQVVCGLVLLRSGSVGQRVLVSSG